MGTVWTVHTDMIPNMGKVPHLKNMANNIGLYMPKYGC